MVNINAVHAFAYVLYSGNINPEQVSSHSLDCNCTKIFEFFTDAALLVRIPQSMLHLSALYAGLIGIGLLMITEKPRFKDDDKPKLSSKLIKTFQFLYSNILNTRDFWFLFLSRSAYKAILLCCVTLYQAVVYDHHRRSLDLLEVSQPEIKWR